MSPRKERSCRAQRTSRKCKSLKQLVQVGKEKNCLEESSVGREYDSNFTCREVLVSAGNVETVQGNDTLSKQLVILPIEDNSYFFCVFLLIVQSTGGSMLRTFLPFYVYSLWCLWSSRIDI